MTQNKQILLQELESQLATGDITVAEIQKLISNSSTTEPENHTRSKYFTINTILYLLGTLIVAIGVIFFVAQLWSDIGSIGRIVSTLGFGLLFAGLGAYLLPEPSSRTLGAAFHFLGGLLMPSGIFVTLYELNVDITEPTYITVVFATLAAIYGYLSYLNRHGLLQFLAIINATVVVYALVSTLNLDSVFRFYDIYTYLTIFIGASYLLLATTFKDTWSLYLIAFLNGAGSLAVLGAGFIEIETYLGELLYPILLIVGIKLAIHLHSKVILFFTTGFVLAYITYITNEYFADSLGWPISLILLGLLFLAAGYFSLKINRQYITKN